MTPKIEILDYKEGIIKELKDTKTLSEFKTSIMSYGLLETLINLRFFYNGDDLLEMNNALIKIHKSLLRFRKKVLK